MNIPKINEAIPLIGTTLGGIIVGALATNIFTVLEWNLEWETLVAGLLGLTGGWLAYKAATDHRRATENRNEYIFIARHFADMYKASEMLNKYCKPGFISKLMFDEEIDFAGTTDLLEGATHFEGPLPLEITQQLERLCEALAVFKTATSRIKSFDLGNQSSHEIDDPVILMIALSSLKAAVNDITTFFTAKAIAKIPS
ncbi:MULTISPECIES: hypothetical protein [Thalassospira]|uniref:hypothetical protein n=1 Tax=Thalassospira TaxID=168934 RepID=UPI00080FB00A|nr:MULTISPECIES: hypothetical protein [Thalassospira]OCK08642.1 hypothetical protein KO164_2821 [Thalassospira sp. KO164]SEE54006.1 hypothetical protein SAMN04515623_2850 [Thalassospira permensis]